MTEVPTERITLIIKTLVEYGQTLTLDLVEIIDHVFGNQNDCQGGPKDDPYRDCVPTTRHQEAW